MDGRFRFRILDPEQWLRPTAHAHGTARHHTARHGTASAYINVCACSQMHVGMAHGHIIRAHYTGILHAPFFSGNLHAFFFRAPYTRRRRLRNRTSPSDSPAAKKCFWHTPKLFFLFLAYAKTILLFLFWQTPKLFFLLFLAYAKTILSVYTHPAGGVGIARHSAITKTGRPHRLDM